MTCVYRVSSQNKNGAGAIRQLKIKFLLDCSGESTRGDFSCLAWLNLSCLEAIIFMGKEA